MVHWRESGPFTSAQAERIYAVELSCYEACEAFLTLSDGSYLYLDLWSESLVSELDYYAEWFGVDTRDYRKAVKKMEKRMRSFAD